MAIVTDTPNIRQRRQQELTDIVGTERAVNADNNMDLLKHINRGLWTSVGILVGGLIASTNKQKVPTGLVVGGASGLAVALLGEQLGKLKASHELDTPSKKEMADGILDPGLKGYVMPGYVSYRQQQIDNRAYNRDLERLARKSFGKSAAVFTTEDVEEMIEEAEEKKLRNREILSKYTPKQVVELANGIGPDWEPDFVAKTLNFLMPWARTPAVIHDLEWAEGSGNKRNFQRSNKRLRYNAKKLLGDKPVYDPRNVGPDILYALVSLNRPHYVKGRSKNPYIEASSVA